MGIIADALKANLEALMEMDKKLLDDINQLQTDISRTIKELATEEAKLVELERKELEMIRSMTEEEYLQYLTSEA